MTSSKPGGFRNIPPPQGKPTSVYGRFIPREELSGFSAWNPGTLDNPDAETPVYSGVQRPAPPPPPAPPPEPEPEAVQVDPAEELNALLHSTRQQAYQDGYRDGLVALENFKQSHARQVASQIGSIVGQLGEQLEALQQEMARSLAVTATHLARQMVMSELQIRPDLVVAVAEQALEALLLSARHITLRVNPDDHALVAEGAGESLAARGARLVSDRAVSRGGCLIESDIGVVDASMETRWHRTAAAMGSDEHWAGATPSADTGPAAASAPAGPVPPAVEAA